MEPRHQLLHELQALLALNPDTARLRQDGLLALARETGADGFAEAATFAERLADAYEASAWKRAESAAMRDYFAQLERAVRLLEPGAEHGGTEPRAEQGGGAASSSVSLVPARFFSGFDWCRLHASAGFSDRVLAAVDAAQNRNRWVESVMETMFLVLQALDGNRALAWELAFLERRRGRLDPDVVRDLLAAWETFDDLPPAAMRWLLDWSADEMLERQWPAVVRRADRLLRRRALRRWGGSESRERHAGLVHLRKLATENRADEEALEHWLVSGLGEIGERVRHFLEFAAEESEGAALPGWRQEALACELRALGLHFTPVLLLADILLRVPGGATRFALAFFGLGRGGEAQWRRRLDALAEKAVRRMFLAALRSGEAPERTIRRLCAGDARLCERLLGALDLATGQFDSLAQRDKTVRGVAAHYLNQREHRLLAMEIQKRYRRLMRVLHPDSLGRLLAPEQVAGLGDAAAWPEMMAVAAAAKRFVERRRDLSQQLEAWVAAEMEFVREIRRRRHQNLCGLEC